MLDLLRKIKIWADVDENSWMMHGIIAIPLTLTIGGGCTSMFYLLREGEQYFLEKVAGTKPKYKDHFMDWFSPTSVALFVETVRYIVLHAH